MEVDHGVGHGPMLAMGPAAADRKVETCIVLASRLPVTLAAMSAGDLDWWRAAVIAAELAEASAQASAQACAAVEELIHPQVGAEAAGAVRRRVRRVLAGVDADAVQVQD